MKAKETRPNALKAKETRPNALKAKETRPNALKAKETRPNALKAKETQPDALKAKETQPNALKAKETRPNALKAIDKRRQMGRTIRPNEFKHDHIPAVSNCQSFSQSTVFTDEELEEPLAIVVVVGEDGVLHNSRRLSTWKTITAPSSNPAAIRVSLLSSE